VTQTQIEGDLLFEAYRPRMRGVAVRLGAGPDVDDILQEAWIRWHRSRPEEIENIEAFLTTVVTRLCLDRVRRARARREVFTDCWRREPVDVRDTANPDAVVGQSQDVSRAFLVVLRKLSRSEASAFLLRDVFDLPYPQVAAILKRSEPAVRQLVHRARHHLRSQSIRSAASLASQRNAVDTFLVASRGGGDEALSRLVHAISLGQLSALN
jgi:RNA polymerase sigma-70 factor, ECF subfamily